MTSRPVAPVIPSARLGRPREGTSGASRPVPLASPPGRSDVVYGFGRIDASGQVADRAAIATLGWRGGDRLTLTADAGVMIARRDPGGMVTVPSRPYVVIPGASAPPIAGRMAHEDVLYNNCIMQTLTYAQDAGGRTAREHPADPAVVGAVLTASR